MSYQWCCPQQVGVGTTSGRKVCSSEPLVLRTAVCGQGDRNCSLAFSDSVRMAEASRKGNQLAFPRELTLPPKNSPRARLRHVPAAGLVV